MRYAKLLISHKFTVNCHSECNEESNKVQYVGELEILHSHPPQ